VQLGGSGTLHAAFLKESRIRSRVQCCVQEIRVARSSSTHVRLGERGAPIQGARFAGELEIGCGKSFLSRSTLAEITFVYWGRKSSMPLQCPRDGSKRPKEESQNCCNRYAVHSSLELSNYRLFRTQRLYRINRCCTACGNDRSRKRQQEDRGCRKHDDRRIQRIDLEQE
jgi:hypothetical protein